MNSKLLDWYISSEADYFSSGYIRLVRSIENAPIVPPSTIQRSDYNEITSSVLELITLLKEKELSLKRQILSGKLGKRILELEYFLNDKVFQLYSLNPEDKALIEKISKRKTEKLTKQGLLY